MLKHLINGTSLALHTDLYQLSMAQGYFLRGKHELKSVFHYSFRKAPFGNDYIVFAGLGCLVDYVKNFQFTTDDIEYLRTIPAADGTPMFCEEFLTYLSTLKLTIDMYSVHEGELVFANEPILRVEGPLLQCQLLETPLLNLCNFQSLVATNAAMIYSAAGGDPVLEFGTRRAQGFDGLLSATRAAIIGGVAATSNVLAGKLYGIPVKGTIAHSWVMSHDTEIEAFKAYAEAMPNNVILLVDTYETIEGIKNAIEVGRELEAKGQKLFGVRLDSGDLARLSRVARRLLDEAGFTDTKIIASNDLDAKEIRRLKGEGAKIDIWAVGTRLVTCYEQPAISGVYKLSSIEGHAGRMSDRMKFSQTPEKSSLPGIHDILRVRRNGRWLEDIIIDIRSTRYDKLCFDDTKNGTDYEPLLGEVFKHGQHVGVELTLQQYATCLKDRIADYEERIHEQYPVQKDDSVTHMQDRIRGRYATSKRVDVV